MKTKHQGFTLIELMIVINILALLAAIAYPAYETFIRRTRLENVRSELLQNAKNLERYYAQKATFSGYPAASLVQNEYFTIGFISSAPPSASGYTLQAVPASNYASRETCTVFLNDSGIFWAVSKGGQSCPGYEEPHSK